MRSERKANAEKCAKIIQKYEKIVGIRVKDVIFKRWMQKLQNERSLLNQSRSNLRSAKDSQLMFTERDFSEYDRLTEQSSVVSSHFLKAKLVYSLKKIFNKHVLKPHFDGFLIKTFYNYKLGWKNLKKQNQVNALRLLQMHQILIPRFTRLKRCALNQLWSQAYRYKQVTHKLQRVIGSTVRKRCSHSFHQWRVTCQAANRQVASSNLTMLIEAQQQNVYSGLFSLVV